MVDKKYYEIGSVRLKDYGKVGDIIALTNDEVVKMPYKGYLRRVEGIPAVEEVGEPGGTTKKRKESKKK